MTNTLTKLETIIINPAVLATHAVIWLHGLGADGHDFAEIAPQLGLPQNHSVRFIFPHAPVRPITINGGHSMRAWYDIISFDLKGRDSDSKGIDQSTAQITGLIQEQVNAGIKPENIILAGFSQGGAMALHTGLNYPDQLGGILALSCYLLRSDELTTTKHPNMPIMIAHGSHDPVLPLMLGEHARDKLKTLGYKPTWHSYPMEHSVCPQEITEIGNWINSVVNSLN